MPNPLPYESPRHVETNKPPPVMISIMSLMSLLVALSAVFLFIKFNHAHSSTLFRILGLGELSLAGAIAICTYTLHSTTALFSDRIQLELRVGTFRFWRRQHRWADIKQADVFRKWRPGDNEVPGDRSVNFTRGYTTLTFTIGWTIVMCNGDGVRFLLSNDRRLLVGSADPENLAAIACDLLKSWNADARTHSHP